VLGGVPAVLAGDFLLLSGHMAPDVGDHPMRDRSEAQTAATFESMTATLDEAGSSPASLASLLERGGSSLDRLVSLWAVVDGDADEFLAVRQLERLGRNPPVVTITRTGALYVPECRVAIDGVALIDA
jgi:enamine deaminase RidA (YjgF/YER057c/UK114 family)